MSKLIEPYGGELVNGYLTENELAEERRRAAGYPVWSLNARQHCEVELLLNGGFSPLTGFMDRAAYERVLEEMRLADGRRWPLPVTLDVSEAFAEGLARGQQICLNDAEGVLLAVLVVEDLWSPDRRREAKALYGSLDENHPGVDRLLNRTGPVYLGGRLLGIDRPTHYDFKRYRYGPGQLRESLLQRGWVDAAAFGIRRVMHRPEQAVIERAGGPVVIQCQAGPAVPGDIDYFTRVRCLERAGTSDSALVTVLPWSGVLAAERSALLQAIVARNHGCRRLLLDPADILPADKDLPAGIRSSLRAVFAEWAEDLAMDLQVIPAMRYDPSAERWCPTDEAGAGAREALTAAEVRAHLDDGSALPSWFALPDVEAELAQTCPPRRRQGFTVFFTGLSGSGKSTIANALIVKLKERSGRPVTLLDGDLVRKHLSSELGFSKEHRNINILRIGFVAGEITHHRGVAVCAPIAPYRQTRRQVREMVEASGGFIEVYVATPLAVCEARDRKGLYAKARAGEIKEFTGISDPYEVPERPEIAIDTRDCSPEAAAERVLARLCELGYLAG